MLALTSPPDRAIPVLWHNFIRKFNVPGRLDTVPSAHSRSLASVRFLPQTRTPLRVGAKCGRPHRGSNRALTTGTSVGFRRLYPLGHGGDNDDDDDLGFRVPATKLRYTVKHMAANFISSYGYGDES